ncbi:hypothetical protein ACM6U7_004175, partial [Vibrio vulnificus]
PHNNQKIHSCQIPCCDICQWLWFFGVQDYHLGNGGSFVSCTYRWLFTQCALPTQWFEWRDYQDQSSEVAMQYDWFLIGMRTIATIYVTDN